MLTNIKLGHAITSNVMSMVFQLVFLRKIYVDKRSIGTRKQVLYLDLFTLYLNVKFRFSGTSAIIFLHTKNSIDQNALFQICDQILVSSWY